MEEHRTVKSKQQIECLIVYDEDQKEHFLPIVPIRMKEARQSGYECIKVTNLSQIHDDIVWARQHMKRLDLTLLPLIQLSDEAKTDL